MIARRDLLRGAAALPIAGALSASAAPLAPGDRRLVELVDAYVTLDREIENTAATAPHFEGLIARLDPIEREIATTSADSMRGVMAKVRVCQVSSVRDCMGPVPESIAADLWRLFGGEGTP